MTLRPSYLLYLSIFIILFHSVADVSAQKIYYAENGAVKRANLDGTGIQIVVPSGASFIAYDADNDFLFYSSTTEIYRSAGDGTGAVQIGDFGAFAGYSNMDVFPGNEQIFYVGITDDMDEVWLGSYYDAITDNQINITPSAIPSNEFLDIAYNEAEDFLYYSDYNNGAIFQSDASGSFHQAVVSSEAYGPIGIDYINNALYWVRVTGGFNYEIRRLDLNTFASSIVKTSSTNEIVSIDVYPKINTVLFAQSNGIFRMALDGTGLTQIISGSNISDIAVAPDVSYPTHTVLNPLDNSVDAPALSSPVSITFSESVKRSVTTGTATETSIRFFSNPGNVPLGTPMDRSSANISISGSTVTITPPALLAYGTNYYILIGSKVFSDLNNNDFSGFSAATQWNFTTEEDQSQYYSRVPTGDYDNPTTWTHSPTHSGAAASDAPGGTGTDAFIGPGHVVTMTANIGVIAASSGLTIKSGGTLNAAGFDMSIGGDLIIAGTLLNPGRIISVFGGIDIFNTSGTLLVVQEIVLDDGLGGEIVLHSDIVTLNGITTLSGGTLNQNGFNVCDGMAAPPVTPIFSNKKSTSVTLSWTKINPDDAFIVMRQGSTVFQPAITSLYNANAVFGSGDAVGAGNFVVYKGPATTVDITGLSANTNYEFDMYSYSTIVGGCYNINNPQFASLTSCGVIAAPLNPVNASYCAGDIKPAINVNSPGSGRNINWYDAAIGGNLVPGDVSGGDGRGGVFIPTAASGTFYAEIYDGTTECTSDVRTAVTLTLNPIVTPGTPTGTQTVCVGDDPTVISGGTATGGDGNYTYQWESATASTTGPYTDISGATLVNYDPPAGISQTTHYRVRVTSSTCTSQIGNFISVTIGSPTNVTGLTNTPGDAQITLNWTNPASCFDEVLIIGKQGSVPASTPTGDGTAYTASTVFGSGTAVVPNEFVVYKGSATSVVVTSLTNSISYSFKIFTRKGTAWSSGAITSGTGIPTPPIIAFTPINGATNVSVTTNITIAFNEAVRNINNSAIDNSNVASLITLKLNNAAGADIPFTATINGAKDLITVDPTSALLPTQLCYVSIASVEDSNNNATTSSSITFTTQAGPSITNVSPLSACVGQNVVITGTNFGTALPVVSVNSVNIPVVSHTATSITLVPSIAVSGVVTVMNMDLSLSTVSSSTLTVSALPNIFSVTGGGAYCVGGNGVTIGLSNSQSGVEYEVYLGASTTNVKMTPGGGAFNFTGFFTAAGTYTVKAKNAGNCSADMSGSAVVQVNDIPSGTGSIGSSRTTTICQDESVDLTAVGFQNALTYVWTLPAELSTTSSTSASTISVKGDAVPGGKVTVAARNDCGLSSEATTFITVNPLPVVSIQAPPANEQIIDDLLQFTSSVDVSVSSYAWSFGDGGSSSDVSSTAHAYTSEGQFTVSLIVKTAAGCEGNANANLNITEFPTLSSSAIKNVVTANEDGKNDKLIVENIERFPNNTLSVLDRWGVEVHNQDAYNNDWDFKKGGNYLPAGSYICIIKFNDSGTVITRTITLIKK